MPNRIKRLIWKEETEISVHLITIDELNEILEKYKEEFVNGEVYDMIFCFNGE